MLSLTCLRRHAQLEVEILKRHDAAVLGGHAQAINHALNSSGRSFWTFGSDD